MNEVNEVTEFLDKKKLMNALLSNSSSLKLGSEKIAGKSEAMQELFKIVSSGEFDFIAGENKDDDIDSMRELKKTRRTNIPGTQNGSKKKAL